MKGKDIIDFLTYSRLLYKEVLVNFSFNNNGAFVYTIKGMGMDVDGTPIIDIGKIDELINNEFSNKE